MDLLFKLLILLTPVPITWFVYRFLRGQEEKSDDIEANFSNRVKIRIVGVIASYLGVLSLVIFSFFPSLFGFDLKNEATQWNFVIKYQRSKDPNSPIQERSGSIIAGNKAGPSKKIRGLFYTENDISLADERWESDGFIDNETFYIPVALPNVTSKVVGLGSWNREKGRAELRVFSLFQANSHSEPVYGVMTLEKRYPWLLVLLLSLVPLVIIFPLSKVGTLLHNFIDADIKLPIWDGSIKAKLGGATAAYFICFGACYLLFFEGVPQSLATELEMQEQVANRYQGAWYYRLFHAGSSGAVEYAGRINIDTTPEHLNVRGRMTKLWLSRASEYNCYETVQIDKSKLEARNDYEPEYHWTSETTAIVGNTLVTVYKFVGANNENRGVLFATIFDEKSKEGRWSYYDLSDWRPDSWFINNGFIEAFRPEQKNVGAECKRFVLDIGNA